MSTSIYQGTVKQNETKNLESIADGYESKLEIYDGNWISYALQKDAIQNSWDAIIGRSHSNYEDWSVTFEVALIRDKKCLLITDVGTTGLIGSTWETDDQLDAILNSNNDNENLAFFLNSNWSSKSGIHGGKRGRGKSLFLVASNKKSFYFESLREDGKRVFGGQFLEESSKSIKNLLTTDRQQFNLIIGHNTLSPLSKQGTRIIIVEPDESIINAIEDGTFKDYASKTWWEIIKKYNANIFINSSGVLTRCEVPHWYDEKYLGDINWLSYKKELINVGKSNEKNQIKKIFLYYTQDQDIPDDIKGISIQRRGMSIEHIPSEKLVHSDGMEKVYGWVELNETLESNLYELEDVEHLTFKWKNNPALGLKTVIADIARQFAKEVKIIETDETKKHNLNRKIEKDVADKINKYLSDLGFRGMTCYGPTHARGKKTSNENPLRISFINFLLPRSSRRVEYGEKINAVATLMNDTKEDLKMRFKVSIVSQDKTIKTLERDVVVQSGSEYDLGWENELITENNFSDGVYSFRTKATLLDDTNIFVKDDMRLEKGYWVKASISFSINQDHNAHGFLDFRPTASADKRIYITSEETSDGHLEIQYNTEHPYIKNIMAVNENDKEKQTKTKSFLLETGIIVAFNHVLKNDLISKNPKLFDDVNAEEADPIVILPRILEEVSKFMWSTKDGN